MGGTSCKLPFASPEQHDQSQPWNILLNEARISPASASELAQILQTRGVTIAKFLSSIILDEEALNRMGITAPEEVNKILTILASFNPPAPPTLETLTEVPFRKIMTFLSQNERLNLRQVSKALKARTPFHHLVLNSGRSGYHDIPVDLTVVLSFPELRSFSWEGVNWLDSFPIRHCVGNLVNENVRSISIPALEPASLTLLAQNLPNLEILKCYVIPIHHERWDGMTYFRLICQHFPDILELEIINPGCCGSSNISDEGITGLSERNVRMASRRPDFPRHYPWIRDLRKLKQLRFGRVYSVPGQIDWLTCSNQTTAIITHAIAFMDHLKLLRLPRMKNIGTCVRLIAQEMKNLEELEIFEQHYYGNSEEFQVTASDVEYARLESPNLRIRFLKEEFPELSFA